MTDSESTSRHGKRGWSLLWETASARIELVWFFVVALVVNLGVWYLRNTFYPFSTVIPLTGIGVIALNAALSLLLIRKEAILSQALALTALIAQVLLLVLIVRTGASLH